MSALTDLVSSLSSTLSTVSTKVDTVIASNKTLTEQAVSQQQSIDQLNASVKALQDGLTAAQGNTVTADELAALQAAVQQVADLAAKLG